MAYTVPGMTGVPGSVYYTNQSYYMKGATLPGIGSGHRLYALTAASLASGFEVAPAYGYISSIGAWAFFGWSYQDAYLNVPFLTSINGKNVTALCHWTYSENTNVCTLNASRGAFELYSDGNTRAKTLTGFTPTIPSTITYMPRLFYGQTQLRGIINIDANPTTYTDWLKGTRQLIKLTGKSTMLEELAAGYSNVSVYIPPTAKLLAQRINAETGDLDDEGTKPKITMTMTGDPVNTTYSLELYMDDLSTPLDTRTFTVPDSGEYEIIFTPNETLDMDTSHTFRAKITDSYGTVREVSDVLTQAFFTMDMGFEGHEIAFGGSAKELQDLKDAGREDEIPANGKFNCFMDVGFRGKVDGYPAKHIGASIHIRGKSTNPTTLTLSSTVGGTRPLDGNRYEINPYGTTANYEEVFDLDVHGVIRTKEPGIYLVNAHFYFTDNYTANDILHGYVGINTSTNIGFNEVIYRTPVVAPWHGVGISFAYPLPEGIPLTMMMHNQNGARGRTTVNGNISLMVTRIGNIDGNSDVLAYV